MNFFKFDNPKTTYGGYMMLLGTIASVVGKLMAGQMPELQDLALLVGGISLIMAKDGKH